MLDYLQPLPKKLVHALPCAETVRRACLVTGVEQPLVAAVVAAIGGTAGRKGTLGVVVAIVPVRLGPLACLRREGGVKHRGAGSPRGNEEGGTAKNARGPATPDFRRPMRLRFFRGWRFQRNLRQTQKIMLKHDPEYKALIETKERDQKE